MDRGDQLLVSRDQVLETYRVLSREGTLLLEHLQNVHARYLLKPGMDPVSKDAVLVYSWKFVDAPDSLHKQYWKYAQGLIDAAKALHATALTYGFTEDEIRTAVDRAGP